MGRSGLVHDYPRFFRVAHHLVGGVRRVLSHPRWWRSHKVYSHTTVVWSAGWTVNVYVVGRPRRRRPRRVTPPVRRRPWRTTPGGHPRWWRRPLGKAPRGEELPGLWHRLVRVVRRRRGYLLAAGAATWAAEATTRLGHPVRWRWCRLRNSYQGGVLTLLAAVRYSLRGRGYRGMAGVVRPLLRATRRAPHAVGASIRCAGRFGRKQRAEYKVYGWGRLTRSGVGAPVEQSRLTLPLKFGVVAVTLTVSFAG